MKISKSHKILLLISAVFLCLIMAVSFNFAKKEVMADEEPSIELTSTTFKVEETSITLVSGYKYKKGSSDLYVMVGDTKYTFSSEENKLSFVVDDTEGNVSLVENSNEFVFNVKIDGIDGVAKLVVGATEAPKATYEITVTTDENAPTYDSSEFNSKKEQYLEDLKKNLMVEVDDKEYYKPLGSNKYITLPSMKEFVSDDTTPYEEMTYVVHYKNSKSDTTYSSGSTKVGKDGSDTFKIPVEVAGVYKFYVQFIDSQGNKMEDDYCKDFVFSFEIWDGYPVVVDVSKDAPANGYLKVLYKLGKSVFDVTGNSTPDYKLEYSQTENGTYVDVTNDKDINFSKEDLSFTPTETGCYKVTCTATSSNVAKLVDENFVIVKVLDEPTVINEPDGPFVAWVKGHVVSVVFLCIGFLCLVGIVVLLFIKPKEEIDEEPTTKEIKKTKNKNE